MKRDTARTRGEERLDPPLSLHELYATQKLFVQYHAAIMLQTTAGPRGLQYDGIAVGGELGLDLSFKVDLFHLASHLLPGSGL